MNNILIIKRDKLGDLILTSFLIQEVKKSYPNSNIDLWVTSFAAIVHDKNRLVRNTFLIYKFKLFRLSGLVDIVRQFLTLLRLRHTRYDLVILAGGEYSPKAIKYLKVLKFAHSIGYCPEPESEFYNKLTHPVPPLAICSIHESVKILNLFREYQRSCGREADISQERPKIRPAVGWANSVEDAGVAFRARHELDPGSYVVVGLGARKPKRQPTAGQVVRWANWLIKKYGLPVVVSFTPKASVDPGYPNDDALATSIKGQCPSVILMGGTIEEAIGVICEAFLVVIPDSGLMHAATSGRPKVLGLFADAANSPSPAQWGPVGNGCETLVAETLISDVPDQDVFTKITGLVAGQF